MRVGCSFQYRVQRLTRDDFRKYYHEYSSLDFGLYPPEVAWLYPHITYGGIEMKNDELIAQALINVDGFNGWIYLKDLRTLVKECRHYGVASSLVKQIESDYLWLHNGIYLQCNNDNRSFYEHLGYRVYKGGEMLPKPQMALKLMYKRRS